MTKKKRNMFKKKQEVVGSSKVVLPHTFCVLKLLTLSNNNWTSAIVQIKFTSGDLLNFTLFFEDIVYQVCLTNVFLCVFIKFSTRINNNFSAHRQGNYFSHICVWSPENGKIVWSSEFKRIGMNPIKSSQSA